MPEKNYKPLLIIGIAAIAAAMTGIYFLEPPAQAVDPLPSETPSQFETVLTPEDLAAMSEAPRATFASPGPSAFVTAARPSPVRLQTAGASASAGQPSARLSASSVRSTSPRPSPTSRATRRPSASARPTPSPRPSAESSQSAVPATATVSSEELPGSASAQESPEPPPTSSAAESPGSPHPTGSDTEETALPSPSASRAVRQPSASASAAIDVQQAARNAPAQSAAVMRGGGLLAAADSKFTITTEGVEEAGGLKLIEGFRANGEAVLRDIRNTLLSSSSLVRAYKDGEEIGGFEPIGTGTVLELENRSGEVVDTAVVLMPGDVTGSGELSISQLTRMAAALDGSSPLTGVYLMAADVDGSGILDEGDLMAASYALNRRNARRAAEAAAARPQS